MSVLCLFFFLNFASLLVRGLGCLPRPAGSLFVLPRGGFFRRAGFFFFQIFKRSQLQGCATALSLSTWGLLLAAGPWLCSETGQAIILLDCDIPVVHKSNAHRANRKPCHHWFAVLSSK